MPERPRDFSQASDDLDALLNLPDDEGGLIDPSSIPYSGGSQGITRGPSVDAAYYTRQCREHRGHAVVGDPTLLGSSYRDGLLIPGNSVTVLLARETMAVAFPVGWASYRSPEFNSHLRGALVFWPWKDMAVPTDVDGAARRIAELHDIHTTGKIVEVACFGGHGRTGTLLAILAALHLKWPADEAVDRLRVAYCDRAVESKVQEMFVRDMIRRLESKEVNKP